MTDGPEAPADANPLNAAVLDRVKALARAIREEVRRVYIGPEYVVESLLIALVAQGHILLEGVPGIAKTTLVKTFAQVVDASYRRIQFTPDLLPSDITGTYILDMRSNEFVLREGPIFANIVLGDEINRAPAKTQSALLEAMQERQVTVEGTTRKLEPPFLVLATQNPVEQEGVYLLPEAQLDRFLIKLTLGYPSFDDELEVMRTHDRPRHGVEALISPEQVLQLSALADTVHMDEELLAYIVRLAHYTRNHQHVDLGASPRAAIALMRAAKARALLQGRDYVLPDDVRLLASRVLAHRIIVSPEAELNGFRGVDVIKQAVDSVRYGRT